MKHIFRASRLLTFLTVFLLTLPAATATAELERCTKLLDPILKKTSIQIRKEFRECARRILDEEEDRDEDLAEGESPFKASRGMDNRARNCQNRLEDIGVNGVPLGSDPRSRSWLFRGYRRIVNVANNPNKCTAEDLARLSGMPFGNADTFARQMLAGIVANAWHAQVAFNSETPRALAVAATTRCEESALPCRDDSACDPSDEDDVCVASRCPDCERWGRPPSGGSRSVPACHTATCKLGPASIAVQDGPVGPLLPTPNRGLSLLACDIPELLAGDLVVVGPPQRVDFDVSSQTTMCLDVVDLRGLIAKELPDSVLPPHTVATCADREPSGDDCAGFTSCTTDNGSKLCSDFDVVGFPSEGDAFLRARARLTVLGSGANDGLGLDGVLCTPDDDVPISEEQTLLFTTEDATGELYDGGPGGPAGTFSTSSFLGGTELLMTGGGLDAGRVKGELVAVHPLIDPQAQTLLGDSLLSFYLACE